MVLIAAAVCTKAGKTIVSRQFVEMTKARIEGLLAAFPKLMTSGKQHTFVETDSVRYVYQPMEKLYMLLITTKASNILEDLETLRLFSKVIPEYCRSLEEKEIIENAFDLIFAFDEIVALGYRESVNLAQIKTFVEMDSHEEKVYQAVRQTQEREAKQKMRERAKELQRQRMEQKKSGMGGTGRPYGGGSSEGFGNNSTGGISNHSSITTPSIGIGEIKQAAPAAKPATAKNALKLGGKSRDADTFVDQLKSEGEKVTNNPAPSAAPSTAAAKAKPVSDVPMDNVHLRLEDKIVVRVGRDGGLQNFELSGLLTLRVSDEKYGRIKIQLENTDQRGIQLQTHPNVDKELFKSKCQIGLKNPAKPFPLNTDVGVLKWRYQTQDESSIPLTINCWPSENTEGGCDVNIEYELEHTRLELHDVCITIPLPMGITPSIAECDGDYNHDGRKNILQWSLPVIDAVSKQGSMEFSVPNSIPTDFFPLDVSFSSKISYAELQPSAVQLIDDEAEVKFSTETLFYTDKYEIV
ncbi:coatomer subunit delta [Toxorhynchites rutilus septentrionalis]|uniref:coatomer subunit delta n=1 Tax=Toxorhynchites rutilus septentrionalis TaxID=329112 RepID=UPI0024798F33|nr:coatomer subunit delta [Toxorhynchites rutilus septentrionalis]